MWEYGINTTEPPVMVTSVVVWVSSNFKGHAALLLDLMSNGSRTVFYWNMVISIDMVFVVLMFLEHD